jgi:hypothetical protein
LPDVLADPSSIISGQNVYYRRGRAEPRSRLSQLGTDVPTVDVANGAFQYSDLDGTEYQLVTSKGTVSFLNTDNSWDSVVYVSGTSNEPPSGSQNDRFRGGTVYLPRRDLNLAVFTNTVDPIFAWGGPSDGTGFSTLTQSVICHDLAIFDDRVVAWNIRELSSNSRLLTRCQWSVAGGPEDWTGIGAGFQDLLHMRGAGTRIFAEEDEMILASTRELWRGRRTIHPLTFDFSPINTQLGMPYASAAIQTSLGIFWLADDYMVYRIVGERIEPVGEGIQRTLRDTAVTLEKAFFSYDDELQQLTLYYSTQAGTFPQRAFTLHIDEQRWTPHIYQHELTGSFVADTTSSTITWGDLTGTLDSQISTWDELLGDSTPVMAILSSGGTVFQPSSTASLDETQVVTAQLVTGGLFTNPPDSVKFADEVRLSLRGTSASSLSVSVSGNLGGSYQNAQEFAMSVQSNTSQQVMRFGVSGTYHALKFESDDTGWQLGDVFARARMLGESV